jgi:tetratricopeptide (TPR) repeat protein/predicted Ser/Thr protein kinase
MGERSGHFVSMNEPLDLKTPVTKPPLAAEDLTGTRVGRFVVRKKLGAGGMGQVYGAEDTTLKRFVAIKRAVPKSKAGPADPKRFLKEAQRASALNHPNIGAMYDVVEHGGELWLVMEYIEGETLRHRLRQPISTEEFFTIAAQCCEGLQAAHEKGIIHGDIKPENIMLGPNNRVKILDFGVARRAWRAVAPDEATSSMETMTSSGGTPAYMAPEVLLQRPDDGRSDIFSLGLVFYEMLGGEQPFHSNSFATTVARIVHEEPPALKNVPGPLAAIITRMMAKNPDERYPSAAAVLEDLLIVQQGGSPRHAPSAVADARKRRVAGTVIVSLAALAVLVSLPPLRHRIRSLFLGKLATDVNAPAELPQTKILAVLPFAVVKDNARLTALGEGVVESLGAKLGKLSEDRPFEVVSPQNLQVRKITSLPDAAKNFGANLGLTVTFESQPNDLVKVTYSVSTPNGATVGSDSANVAIADIFSLEQKIAEGTVKDLKLQLRPEEESALQYHGTDNAAAYQYYLQAQGYMLDHTKAENVDNAMLMAREALKLDPNFGMAKALLGESYWFKYANTKQNQWIPLASANCDEAVKLGNAGADGHVCLGNINYGTGHQTEAASEFQLALGLETTNEEAALGLAHTYEHDGKITDAEKAFQQAVQSHPNSRVSYNDFGTFYQGRNEHEKALQMFARVTQIAPEWYVEYVNIGSTYNDMGQYEKAIGPLKQSITLRPTYAAYVNLGNAYSGLNNFPDAASAYQEATKLDPQQYVTWGNLGDALYYSGKKDQSLAPYRKAAELASAALKVNPHDPDVLSSLASYDSMLGDRKKALLYLGEALQYGHNDKDVLVDAASVYNHLGESGLAVEWLAKAVQAGYAKDRIRTLHDFDNLVSTPGYQQLMKSK